MRSGSDRVPARARLGGPTVEGFPGGGTIAKLRRTEIPMDISKIAQTGHGFRENAGNCTRGRVRLSPTSISEPSLRSALSPEF